MSLGALLCLLSLSQSALLLVGTPYDIFIPLDAGLRWGQGILPGRDYPSPIGLLYAALHGMMLSFDSTDARSIVRADAVVLGLCYLLLWPVQRGMAPALKAIVMILLAGMLMTPLALDAAWGSYRYIADYNRWGWAFYAVALMWLCNPSARTLAAQIAVGLALCCLLYLKLTLFIGASLTTLLGLLWQRRPGDYVIPIALVVVAMAIGLGAGIFVPYLQDNVAAGQATGTLRLSKILTQIILPYNVFSAILTLVVCFIASLPIRLRLVIFASSLLLHLAALQNLDLTVPLSGLPLFLLVPLLERSAGRVFRPAFIQVLAALQAIYLFSVAAVALALQQSTATAIAAQPIGAPQTLGERLLLSAQPSPSFGRGGGDLSYADDVILQDISRARDLMATLPPGTRVAALEGANIALADWPRLRPAPGALLWYDYHRTFNDTIYPPASQIFAGADIILVPVHFTTGGTRRLVQIYQPWLQKCARLVRDNELWQLYEPVDKTVAQPTAASGVSPGAQEPDCQLYSRSRHEGSMAKP